MIYSGNHCPPQGHEYQGHRQRLVLKRIYRVLFENISYVKMIHKYVKIIVSNSLSHFVTAKSIKLLCWIRIMLHFSVSRYIVF